jgi:hypothetical protein
MTGEIRVHIDAQAQDGKRGFAMSCGHIYKWFLTLGEAKIEAEKAFGVKKWTRNYRGEYDGYGGKTVFDAENANLLADSFGKNGPEAQKLYRMMLDTIGREKAIDEIIAESLAPAIGINDVADGFLVRLLARARGIEGPSEEVLVKLLADTKRANHRDVLSMRERLRAKTKKEV